MIDRKYEFLIDNFIERIGQGVPLKKEDIENNFVKSSEVSPDENVLAMLGQALNRSANYNAETGVSKHIVSANSLIETLDESEFYWRFVVELYMNGDYYTIPDDERHELNHQIVWNIKRALDEVLTENKFEGYIPVEVQTKRG